jgi:hypothetical protein
MHQTRRHRLALGVAFPLASGLHGTDGVALKGLLGGPPSAGHQPNTCFYCCRCEGCLRRRDQLLHQAFQLCGPPHVRDPHCPS